MQYCIVNFIVTRSVPTDRSLYPETIHGNLRISLSDIVEYGNNRLEITQAVWDKLVAQVGHRYPDQNGVQVTDIQLSVPGHMIMIVE